MVCRGGGTRPKTGIFRAGGGGERESTRPACTAPSRAAGARLPRQGGPRAPMCCSLISMLSMWGKGGGTLAGATLLGAGLRGSRLQCTSAATGAPWGLRLAPGGRAAPCCLGAGLRGSCLQCTSAATGAPWGLRLAPGGRAARQLPAMHICSHWCSMGAAPCSWGQGCTLLLGAGLRGSRLQCTSAATGAPGGRLRFAPGGGAARQPPAMHTCSHWCPLPQCCRLSAPPPPPPPEPPIPAAAASPPR